MFYIIIPYISIKTNLKCMIFHFIYIFVDQSMSHLIENDNYASNLSQSITYLLNIIDQSISHLIENDNYASNLSQSITYLLNIIHLEIIHEF